MKIIASNKDPQFKEKSYLVDVEDGSGYIVELFENGNTVVIPIHDIGTAQEKSFWKSEAIPESLTDAILSIVEKYDPNPNRYPKGDPQGRGGQFAPKDGKGSKGKEDEGKKVGKPSAKMPGGGEVEMSKGTAEKPVPGPWGDAGEEVDFFIDADVQLEPNGPIMRGDMRKYMPGLGTFRNADFKQGSIVRSVTGSLSTWREIRVDRRYAYIKNGRPGFEGVVVNAGRPGEVGEEVWGYTQNVFAVVKR